MAVPKYNEMYNLYLSAIKDGKEHTSKEIRSFVIANLGLTADELSEKLPGGGNKFITRINYTKTYLKNAELLEQKSRGHCNITDAGLAILNRNITITNDILMEFESFRKFVKKEKKEENENNSQILSSETPEDILEDAYRIINTRLKEKLLAKLKASSWEYFEQIAVDILSAMGYGTPEVTQPRKDGGIDGILHNDEFGFDKIYVQAKKWENNVSGPVAKEFIGTLITCGVRNGVIITTSKFTKDAWKAVESAKSQKNIVLIDGENLVDLMIKYNVGVIIKSTQYIKDIDENYFDEGDD